jgi:hypothetical protein
MSHACGDILDNPRRILATRCRELPRLTSNFAGESHASHRGMLLQRNERRYAVSIPIARSIDAG